MSEIKKYFAGVNPNLVAIARILSGVLSYYMGYFVATNPDLAIHMGGVAVFTNTFINIYLTQKVDSPKDSDKSK